jgi:hypothetical protein
MREDPTSALTAQTPASSVLACRRRSRGLMALAGLAGAATVWMPGRLLAGRRRCRGVMRDHAAVARVRCARCSGDCGCPEGVSGVRAGRHAVSARPRRPGPVDQRRRPGRTAGRRPGLPQQRGRSQRPGVAGSSAALSAAGCGPVRLRPTSRPRRCPVPAVLAELWPGRPDGGVRVDTAAACGYPPLQEPVAGPAAAGRRSQRRPARHSCRRAGRGGGRARPSWPDAPAPGDRVFPLGCGRRATSQRLGAGVTWQIGTFPAPAIEPAPQIPQASQEPRSWPSPDHRCPPLPSPTTDG